MTQWTDRAQQRARRIKRDVVALWIAGQDQRTPLAAKLVAGAVAAYALSPIDLIPDVIPVLGYLDDLLIVPLGIMWAVRLVPPLLMSEFRESANARVGRPISRVGAAVIVICWLAAAALLAWVFWPNTANYATSKRQLSGFLIVPSDGGFEGR
jgi:uncharacterized membrane protein YkvA (DUF1232 family)